MKRAQPPDRPVLVGVDKGVGWEGIVRFAAQEAGRRGVALRILHAMERPLPAGAVTSTVGASALQEQAAVVIDPAMALVRSEFPDVPVEPEPASGSPAALLVDRSREVALIVVGHHGRGGFARLPLGSVSLQVTTHAECPVIVVRPEGHSDPPENRVVGGIDATEASCAALEFAFLEASLRGARLEIVHADYRPQVLVPGLGPPDQSTQAGVIQAEQRALRAHAAARWRQFPDVQVDTRIEHKRPVPALLDAADGAALLVVGSHGRTGLGRLLLGSVSGGVLRAATCPVAVVPEAGSD